MPHLPGHNYVGPGTDLKKEKKPVDADDRIARQHDIAYSKAKTEEEVRSADLLAIQQFGRESLNSPHAAIGAIGLGLKYGVETFTGVRYGVNKVCGVLMLA